jgi:predicted ArsR family transcriptional regulator
MSKKPVKISNKVYLQEEGGKLEEITFEEVILIWLDSFTPPPKTSQEVAEGMGLPYPTVHPKLKTLHEQELIQGEEDMTPRPGKPRLLWQKKGDDLNSVLSRWRTMVENQ